MKKSDDISSINSLLKVMFGLFSIAFLVNCGAGSNDFSEYLGNDYYLYSNSAIDRFIAPKSWNDTTPIIPSKVVRYKIQNSYIVAEREIIQTGHSGSRVATGNFDYWILDTSIPVVIGPMSKNEFEIQIEKLDFSQKLNPTF